MYCSRSFLMVISNLYLLLVYTTQVNSTFRARWLAGSEVISQVLFTSQQPKNNKMASRLNKVNKVTLWSASYSASQLGE